MRVKYNEDILWQVSLRSPSRNGSGCKWVPKNAKGQVGIDCRGSEKSMDMKRSRMSPWRLVKNILEQVFGVGLGAALSLCKLCHAVPHARELQPLQGARCPPGRAGPGTLPAPCGQCHSGKFCSTAKISPSGCLREKGQHHCLHFTEGETERGHRSSIKIQSRSTRLSDSQTLFMGTHHPPHTARVFSAENQDLTLQSLRDIFLRSSMFVISMNWERLRVF